jgi:hypothetical protein
VSAFLAGGDLVDLMWVCGGFRSLDDMVARSQQNGGLDPRSLANIRTALKTIRVKSLHLGYSRKIFDFCESAATFKFETAPNVWVTIQAYFEQHPDPRYQKYLLHGKLKYPTLPTVSFSSRPGKDMVPVELVVVPGGQSRSRFGNDPQIVAQLIKQAAVKPNVRQRFITSGDPAKGSLSIVTTLQGDPTAQAL